MSERKNNTKLVKSVELETINMMNRLEWFGHNGECGDDTDRIKC